MTSWHCMLCLCVSARRSLGLRNELEFWNVRSRPQRRVRRRTSRRHLRSRRPQVGNPVVTCPVRLSHVHVPSAVVREQRIISNVPSRSALAVLIRILQFVRFQWLQLLWVLFQLVSFLFSFRYGLILCMDADEVNKCCTAYAQLRLGGRDLTSHSYGGCLQQILCKHFVVCDLIVSKCQWLSTCGLWSHRVYVSVTQCGLWSHRAYVSVTQCRVQLVVRSFGMQHKHITRFHAILSIE